MRTIKEIGDEIVKALLIEKSGDDGVQKILRQYVESVIDECAERAETEDQVGYNEDGGYSYQTVDRESILKVKKLL